MTGDDRSIVWLASYPKSGSTWIRAILTALRDGPHLFGLNSLAGGRQPFRLSPASTQWALDPRWLTMPQVEQVREGILLSSGHGLSLRKTHEAFRARPRSWPVDAAVAPEPFPRSATRAALHIVRDPRDVACSYAAHFDITVEAAVEEIAAGRPNVAVPVQMAGEQPWLSWSDHCASWMSAEVPFPVVRIRFEDLHADPVATLRPALDAIGVEVAPGELEQAVDRAALGRLQTEEASAGFAEGWRSPSPFFRRGRAGGWRDELADGLVRAVEADHGDMMAVLGYPVTTADAPRAALAQARASVRRQPAKAWHHLPAHLGITVGAGVVPRELDSARRPMPWCQVRPGAAQVRMIGGVHVLVEDGHRATVDLPEGLEPGLSQGWMVQGWAVTLAFAQRGHLSLHASAVEVGGRTLCVAGHSGAGKSTTALALRARGHRLLVDDVSVLTVEPGSAVTVLPFLRGVHLLPDAAELVGIDFAALPRLSSGRRKAAFFAEDPGTEPHTVSGVVVLEPDDTCSDVALDCVTGAERLRVLDRYAGRTGILPAVLGAERYFELLAAVASAVPVWRLRRPVGRTSLDDVVAAIEAIR